MTPGRIGIHCGCADLPALEPGEEGFLRFGHVLYNNSGEVFNVGSLLGVLFDLEAFLLL